MNKYADCVGLGGERDGLRAEAVFNKSEFVAVRGAVERVAVVVLGGEYGYFHRESY